ILHLGGTMLGTSRLNPFAVPDGPQQVLATLARHRVGGVIAIGGEGTLAVAREMHALGVPIVGVPKTIDNDLSGTDFTFGFDTAVSIATEAIDRLHTTAESHHRILICEVMGRHAGWIALHSGMGGGANGILIPEIPFDLDEVVGWVASRFGASCAPILCGSEGALPVGGSLVTKDTTLDAFGHVKLSGIGEWLAGQVEERTGHEARTTVLGHIQRGGSPTAF